ncbi:MAG: two-component system, OmpR family, sensor histidine kinase ResE [Frankiales bacterium]|jgi:PAS domain S-box-containing protein|nr:two-component system, OmpR family, sensor histidine kinase ResE [Frankiales bacterium]
MAVGGSVTGVPFAFLAGVQLVSVGAALGLAGAACFPRLRTRATPVFVIGAVLIAVADALTATTYGHPSSSRLALLRAGGTLLVAVGLATGVLRPPASLRYAPQTAASAVGVGAVVVPLGAPVGPATASAVAAGLAALATLRMRRADPIGAMLLAPAFVFLGVAGALGTAAASSRTAGLAVLAARGAFALLVFAAITRLARASVLAKVTAAMLSGVLLMAVGAVGVGSVVAGVVGDQQADQIRRVAQSQAQALQSLTDQAGSLARVVTVCRTAATPQQCGQLLTTFGALPGSFAATVAANGTVTALSEPTPTRTALLQLRGEAIVRGVLAGSAELRDGAATLAVLNGELTVLGVAPINAQGAPPNTKPTEVGVYGGRVNTGYAKDQQAITTYDVTVLINGQPVASSLTQREASVVAAEAQHARANTGGLAERKVIVRQAQGSEPTAAFITVTAKDSSPLAVLAVSQKARTALAAQRRAFTELFLTALGVMLLVSVLALLLGRRIVEPVRRLTVVASRVRRGDLNATVGAAGSDEVGQLSRAFDAMTASVSQLNDDLRQAADQEATLRARLETVLASMTDGLIATDADGLVTSINPAAASLTGLDGQAAIGSPLRDVVNVREANGHPLFARHIRPGQSDGVIHRGDGGLVSVQIDVAPLDGASGFVVAIRDQSRERELERMKTEFLSNVSHELRTPLTPIRGYAELLRRRPDLSRKESITYVDTILASSARMQRVVDLLVDVAAIEAGRVQPESASLSVDRYIGERLDDWRARYPLRAPDLRRRVARGLPPIATDSSWLTKAFDELVDNAVKHTPAGTPITIAATAGKRGRVHVAVRDAGPGIDPEAMPSLFADFVQANGSATRTVGGLGLGLSFVRRLAEALGLGLDVVNTPGRGVEFILDIPAGTTDVVARRRPRGARGAPRRRSARPTTARRRNRPADPPDG